MITIQTLIHDPISIRLLMSLLILGIILLSKRFLVNIIIHTLAKFKIKQVCLELSAFNQIKKPLNALLTIIGIYVALAVSPFVYYHQIKEQVLILGELTIPFSIIPITLVHKLFSAAIAALITRLVYTLEHLYEDFITELNTKLNLIENTVFIRYISRIISFITLTLGVLVTIAILIPEIKGVITGVGIGGVALAYVAKDSLSSMFSGMILLLDKPFIIGDWITLDHIDGIVEDISFRSTRIRTFDQGLVVIPNNTVGNANITNWSRMKKRRVTFELGISYNTQPEQITLLAEKIKTYLNQHPNIEKDTALVNFTSLGDYTLNIQIIYYSLQTALSDFMTLKQDVNLEILKLCEAQKVEIAFPTQTILMTPSPASH